MKQPTERTVDELKALLKEAECENAILRAALLAGSAGIHQDDSTLAGDLVGSEIHQGAIPHRPNAIAQSNQAVEPSSKKFVELFACGVAHDFNNILFKIQGAAAGLEGVQTKGLEEIDAAVARAVVLSQDLMTVGLPSLRGPINFAAVNDVLNRLTLVLGRFLLSEGITLRTYQGDADPQVSLSTDELDRVLTSLILNASEATPRGGRIDVHVTSNKGEVCIRVADTGAGEAPDDRGGRLGLATTRSMAVKAGGSLLVHSEAGAGTSRSLTLPQEVPSP